MQVYRIIDTVNDSHVDFKSTRDEAHQCAKLFVAPYRDVRVELIDVPLDKESVVNMLRGDGPTMGTVLRTWALTDRGGLKGVPNGE